jgi:hypothetical protein
LLKSLKRSEPEQAALRRRGLIAKESETCRVCERAPTSDRIEGPR